MCPAYTLHIQLTKIGRFITDEILAESEEACAKHMGKDRVYHAWRLGDTLCICNGVIDLAFTEFL